MAEFTLKPNTVVLGERNYEAALDLVMAKAERELLVFDQHLRTGAFNTVKRYDLLREFLNKNANNRIHMVLHEAVFLQNQCPKLLDLLKTYGHVMQVLLTNDFAKIAKDCFVIADNKHTVRRIHIDHARFKYTLDDAETAASLRLRFDELVAETTEPVAISKLGL